MLSDRTRIVEGHNMARHIDQESAGQESAGMSLINGGFLSPPKSVKILD